MTRSGSEGRWADIPSARIRFALEAAFLVLVAAGAAIAGLSPAAIVILMLAAWLLVALIERASSREQTRSLEVEVTPPVAATREDTARSAEIRPRGGYRWLFWRRRIEAGEPLPAPTEHLEERPSRSHVRRIEPEGPLVAEPPVEMEIDSTEIVVTGPAVTKRPLDLPGLEEPEPARATAQPTGPPVARPAREEAPLPPPPPEPTPPTPPPVHPTPPTAYQPPPPRPPAREWNLWDLERKARERAGDATRDEEWTALFVHLREFATPDGVLPKEFDDLVRESFAELIQAA